MSAGIITAKKCFKENIELFGDTQSQPEKFNLYNGLWNLSDSIDQIEKKIQNLSTQLNALQAIVSSLRR